MAAVVDLHIMQESTFGLGRGQCCLSGRLVLLLSLPVFVHLLSYLINIFCISIILLRKSLDSLA